MWEQSIVVQKPFAIRVMWKIYLLFIRQFQGCLRYLFFLKMLICLKLFFRYALLGAASFLGGSMRITVSLCVIMVEITNNLKFLPLIMLVLLISKVVLVFPQRKHCMTLIKKTLFAFIYKFWCFLFYFVACCEILVGCGWCFQWRTVWSTSYSQGHPFTWFHTKIVYA